MKVSSLATTLNRALDPSKTSIDDGWVGLEPTFQSKKIIKLYAEYEDDDEDSYFEHRYIRKTVRKVVLDIERRWRKHKQRGDAWALFDDVRAQEKRDPWNVMRAECDFTINRCARDFELKLGVDPATFEFGAKPIPIAWLYDERFVQFLEELAFKVPRKNGLTPSLLNGGGQFHLSAKCFLTGSLLADDIATRVDHPELSTWMMDWPNCDDRAFRATSARFAAFRRVLDEYWSGAYHPRATGDPTVENAYLDRGFEPAPRPARGLVDPHAGPVGDVREVFQTNFTFGRAVRLRAQNVHPGYWQLAHPNDDGFRPDQIMRYSEANLNRLQIKGELHVKSGKILDLNEVPELDEPLGPELLVDEASWEIRGQQSRVSAVDAIEAVLLDVHYARYLQKHPHVKVRASLLQDQLLVDAEHTIKKHGGEKALGKLRRDGRKLNLAMSNGRIKSSFVEPEILFWSAWRALGKQARAAIANEAIAGFVERVHAAASADPRGTRGDPMDQHRHRVHPLLWKALTYDRGGLDDAVEYELARFERNADAVIAKRPVFSQLGDKPPWPDE